MKMSECNGQIKCDFYGCTNLAKYSFSTKGFLKRELNFCDGCMKEMFECFSKACVPKPVEAPFKRKTKKETK